MKVAPVVILCVTFAFAKPPRNVNSLHRDRRGTCGPKNVKFELKWAPLTRPTSSPAKLWSM
jgi:hypothetical protein